MSRYLGVEVSVHPPTMIKVSRKGTLVVSDILRGISLAENKIYQRSILQGGAGGGLIHSWVDFDLGVQPYTHLPKQN